MHVVTFCYRNVPGIAQAYVAPTSNQMRQLSLNDEDDGAQPQGTEGGCPRCGTQVYLAEQRVAAGNVSFTLLPCSIFGHHCTPAML